MSRTFPRPSSFKPERVVSTTVVWLTLRTSKKAWLDSPYYTTGDSPAPALSSRYPPSSNCRAYNRR